MEAFLMNKKPFSVQTIGISQEETRGLFDFATKLIEENIGSLSEEFGRFSQQQEFSKLCNEAIEEHSDILLNNHNASIDIVREIVSETHDTNLPHRLPNLRGGDCKTLLEILNDSKFITKPEMRKYLTQTSDSDKVKSSARLKNADKAKHTIGLLIRFGLYIHDQSRFEAFPNALEYKVFQKAAILFGLEPFKAVHDFDEIYSDSELINTLSKNNPIYSTRLQSLEANPRNHLTKSMICFMYKLIDAANIKSGGDLEKLSDDEYNLLTLSYYTFSFMFTGLVEGNLATINFPSPITTNLKNVIRAPEFPMDALEDVFDEDYKCTPIALELTSLIYRVDRSLDYDRFDDPRLRAFHAVVDGLDKYASNLLNLISHQETLEAIASKDIRDQIENLKQIKQIMRLFEQSTVVDEKVLKSSIQKITQVNDVIAGYLELSHREFSKNIETINKNISLIKIIFSDERLEQIEYIENSILAGSSQIKEFAINHDFEAISELTEQLAVQKSKFNGILERTVTNIHKKLIPITREPVKANSPDIEESTDEIKQQNTKLRGNLENLNEIKQVLELEVQELKDDLETSKETNQRIANERDIIDSKYTGLIKKTSSSVNGYSEAMNNILFGKASVSDIVTAISETYPNVVWADNFDKLVNKCMYAYPEKLHRWLKLLVDDYYKAIQSGMPDSEAKSLIEPYYAANESDTTMNDESSRNKRKFKFSGISHIMEKHLTIGKEFDPTKTVQLYFDIIDGVMHVGYIGEHLEISSV